MFRFGAALAEAVGDGLGLAITLCGEASGRNPFGDQVVNGRLGAGFAEAIVVGVGRATVRVATQLDADIGVEGKQGAELVERWLGVFADEAFVEVVVDVLQYDLAVAEDLLDL